MALLVRRWTNEDLLKLKAMAAAGASAMKIAAALRRKVSSVKKYARDLGIELPGMRDVRNNQRSKISAAEKDLPSGAQRYDGSFVP
jgi:GcrA cell cycle regulator